jgi:hypothetical protein
MGSLTTDMAKWMLLYIVIRRRRRRRRRRSVSLDLEHPTFLMIVAYHAHSAPTCTILMLEIFNIHT